MTISTAVAGGDYPCLEKGCGRAFDTPQKLSMHRVRMHTHKSAGDNAGRDFHLRKKQSNEERLRKKREYNAKYRHGFRARGKTGEGGHRVNRVLTGRYERDYSMPPSSHPDYKKRQYEKTKARYAALGLNAHGRPFSGKFRNLSPEARENIIRAQKMRRLRERRSARNGVYVYPPPQQGQPKEAPQAVPAASPPTMKHCPECGCNLGRWQFV